jgi:GGDEF domain-containing protein
MEKMITTATGNTVPTTILPTQTPTPDELIMSAIKNMGEQVQDTVKTMISNISTQLDTLTRELQQSKEAEIVSQKIIESMHTAAGKIVEQFNTVVKKMPTYLQQNSQVRELQDNLTKQIKELQQLAYKDQLTQLDNRHALAAFAKTAQGQYVGMTLDIDHFKLVNDTLGHDGGVLVQVPDVSHDRRANSQDNTQSQDEVRAVVKMAEALRAAIEQKCGCTVSIGITDTPVKFSRSEAIDFTESRGQKSLHGKRDGP